MFPELICRLANSSKRFWTCIKPQKSGHYPGNFPKIHGFIWATAGPSELFNGSKRVKKVIFYKKKCHLFLQKSYFFLQKKLLFFTKKVTFFYKKKLLFFTKKSYFFLQKKVLLAPSKDELIDWRIPSKSLPICTIYLEHKTGRMVVCKQAAFAPSARRLV